MAGRSAIEGEAQALGAQEEQKQQEGQEQQEQEEQEQEQAAEQLICVQLTNLRPTQLAVGMHEVFYKRGRMVEKEKAGKLGKYLKKKPMPVVRGPGGVLFLTDHHHLASALAKTGLEKVYVRLLHDWGDCCSEAEFWQRMEAAQLLWLYDEKGTPLQLQELVRRLPKNCRGLKDDPFRSVAAFTRYAGGYHKSPQPFAEFRWANHLRHLVPFNGDPDSQEVIEAALHAAGQLNAAYLPGFKGGSVNEANG